jgi:hypothetical protein
MAMLRTVIEAKHEFLQERPGEEMDVDEARRVRALLVLDD